VVVFTATYGDAVTEAFKQQDPQHEALWNQATPEEPAAVIIFTVRNGKYGRALTYEHLCGLDSMYQFKIIRLSLLKCTIFL